MMRKKRLKRTRTPPQAKNIMILTSIVFALMVYGSIELIDKGIEPTLMDIGTAKTKAFATRAINTAVKFAEDYEFEEVSTVTYDDEGKVATFNWNSAVISEINRVATDRVEEFFHSMNEGKLPEYDEALEEIPEFGEGAEDLSKKDLTVVEIPVGQATGNTILANLGPKVPVNMEFVGSVHTDVVRESEPFGINATFYTIYLIVEAEVQVVIPFTTEVMPVKTRIDIDSGVIMGDIPEFYGGGNNDPSISVPKKDITGD
ncbi:Sporulation protein YunB [Lentibacillus sp. JNUCC-1]|uniref:sporulation protein YunB n=1 Tax=Lentibacillus sp. JNUCC-1 TaxID=2654513 RepID=UPI001324DF3F|nr:sporulation protein YunB [Lentibacillus sp. JNUCC-1]MUV39171.1 Sporulation protein YunB [Lentibacillus sp. JNUCC-1]